MSKLDFYNIITSDSQDTPGSDYETYLQTKKLLSCQKALHTLRNGDELQFQIVHQTEELWMKLMSYTLIDITEYIEKKETHRVITLFHRVHEYQKLMIHLLSWLETMSPKEYLEIRLNLGNGSGKTSPGLHAIHHVVKPLWKTYLTHYIENENLSLRMIYDTHYKHCDAYVIAEALLEFDALLSRFYKRHFELIERTIGGRAKSLKGNDVKNLRAHEEVKLFPQLWEIRNLMTNEWGVQYGMKRDSLNNQNDK